MANYGYGDGTRRYSDEDLYGRGSYYDRDYERDYGQGFNREYGRGEHMGEEYRGGYGSYGRGSEYRGDYGGTYAREYRGGDDRDDYYEQARDFATSGTGIGAGAAVLALAAFGIGWLVGTRWHAETHERIGGMPRSDLRPAPTLDDYHGHVSINDPDAKAGTPPDADEVVGAQRSGKSARESAEALKDADGKQAQSRQSATAGTTGTVGTAPGTVKTS
jgi:hypothetical protein